MPAPATVDELLDLVQKSGVADEGRLKAYVARLKEQGGMPPEPNKAAGLLVRDGLLTFFQAEQLLQGKWKRFNIGKYKVLERLGAGGMGQVFLCEHKLMRRRVAVKVLPTAKASDEASLSRFYREARAVAAVDHPNIVRAYDIDQDDNLHFLVMEYVDGTNLQDLIKKFGPLDVVRACHYVYGAAVGLQHAHEMGLVHRDIKPGNILLDRSGVIKILDLGLARFFHDTDDVLTKKFDESILGTADYLSPEQAEDSHTVDIRTDIYSLGATFYYLLTGSQPFPDGSIPQKLIWHRSREPRPILSLRPDVPAGVVAIVNKMMAKSPAGRYQTPAEVMAALAPWASTPIPPPPDREMPQLSPAVLGGAGGMHLRGPASTTGVAPRTVAIPTPIAGGGLGNDEPLGGSDLPYAGHTSPTLPGWAVNGSSATNPVTPPGLPAYIPPGQAVWESLDDTPAATGEDTGRPSRTMEPQHRPVRPAPSRPGRRLLPFALAGVALCVLLGGAVAAYFAFFKKKDPDPTGPAVAQSKRLFVSKANSGAENTFPSLGEAIRKASPGDTIVIQESPLSEPPLRLSRLRDLTVESGVPGGKPAVIEFTAPTGAGQTLAMVEVSSAENIRLKDLELRGKGVADFGVSVSGSTQGVVLEGITVRDTKTAGFRLLNVAGQAGRPVTLDRVRVVLSQTSEAAVKVEALQTLESRRIAIRNSRFEGPGKAGIRFEGVVVDAEVTGNRLSQLDAAFSFGRAPEKQTVRVQLSQNTVADAKVGVLFTAPAPGGAPGKFDVSISRNYFARTPVLGQADGAPAAVVNSADNGHDPACQQGNLPLAAAKLDSPLLPPPNPDDDATFLRFPAGTAPAVEGHTVGAR